MGRGSWHPALGHAAAILALAACFWAASAAAVEVWMPDTGEVDLNAPRDSAQARFRHAAALIAAGQPVSGVALLEALLREHPDADWSEQARYLVGLGHFAAHSYAVAFDEWEAFQKRYPQTEMRQSVYEMQSRAASGRMEQDLDGGVALFDRLVAQAPSEEFAVRCQLAKADAILEAGRYLRASDAYLELIDYHPDSPWVPYAWYKIGECNLKAAGRAGRGGEHLDEAERTFRSLVTTFPDHALAEKARKDMAEVRAKQAARYRAVAEYYLGPAARPTAALPYLRYIESELADTPEAKWAKQQIKQVLDREAVPVRGEHRTLDLPGVRAKTQEEGAAP